MEATFGVEGPGNAPSASSWTEASIWSGWNGWMIKGTDELEVEFEHVHRMLILSR